MKILDQNRIRQCKRAFATRRIPFDAMRTLLSADSRPKAGDLVLARVTKLGSHSRIELPSGRRASLFPGDEILLTYGNRYAPDQYEAYVPDTLAPCHMVAAGGVAAQATAWHDRLSGPTAIEPIGLVADAERCALNLADFAVSASTASLPGNVFAVFGTAMNAGKTTTAASLVKGFTRAGYAVGAAKITGTGAGGDLWLMRDSGAVEALDFTDAGFPTTFGVDPSAILDGASELMRTLAAQGCSVIVLEIADGLYQTETAALAESEAFRSMLTGTFFAAGDAMGAAAGAGQLAELGHTVLGISGSLTRSPLAVREAAVTACAPVYTIDDLIDPESAASFVGQSALGYALASGQ